MREPPRHAKVPKHGVPTPAPGGEAAVHGEIPENATPDYLLMRGLVRRSFITHTNTRLCNVRAGRNASGPSARKKPRPKRFIKVTCGLPNSTHTTTKSVCEYTSVSSGRLI